MVAMSWEAGSTPARVRVRWIKEHAWETALVAGALVYLLVVAVLLMDDVGAAHACRDRGGHQVTDPGTHQVRCVPPAGGGDAPA